MATTNTAFRTVRPHPATGNKREFSEPAVAVGRFRPQSARADDGRSAEWLGLRLYTEQQVSEILQLSRSQLRKWRMGWNRGQREGPPFKRIGRLIRYPESGLRAYIDEE
jgi:hypothetical protein